MTTGQESEVDENWIHCSTVSLAKGEHFSQDVVLVFSGKRRSSGECDAKLQEALRTRLRVMESSSQDISSLFKDLSARLLSVHAEQDSFILTFKTVEEIWKFSTYLSLGYVARCLENFLCDPSFWLDPALLSDVEICVSLQEEHLATLYLGLLLQEGVFFARAVRKVECVFGEEDTLECVADDLLMVRDVGQEEFWEATHLTLGNRGLVPATSMQPLPYPFYQWFLRKYPCNASGLPPDTPTDTPLSQHPISVGTCVSLVDYEPSGPDELPLVKGEELEVEGLLLDGLGLFVGRSLNTGQSGFVSVYHVREGDLRPLSSELQYMTEEEREELTQLEPTHTQSHTRLLHQLSHSDISTIYRMDRLDDKDFAYIKSQPKSEEEVTPRPSSLAPPSQRCSWIWPHPSLSASQNSLGRSTTMGGVVIGPYDTFREAETIEDDSTLWEELEDTGEESEELLKILDTPTELEEERLWEASLNWLQSMCEREESVCECSMERDCVCEQKDGMCGCKRCVCRREEDVCERDEGAIDSGARLRRLECVRALAKRQGCVWALRRVCYLLGRVCEDGMRLSQARVYYEEALGVCVSGFLDRPLLTALHTHLAALYLQTHQEHKLTHTPTLARAATLLLTQPCTHTHTDTHRHTHTWNKHSENYTPTLTNTHSHKHLLLLLRPLMCHALLLRQRALEGRVCYLWVRMLLVIGRHDEALPFLERLQFLIGCQRVKAGSGVGPDLSWLLSVLYHRRYQPHLALAALSLDSAPCRGLSHAFSKLRLHLLSSERLHSQATPTLGQATPLVPAQALQLLRQALEVSRQRHTHTHTHKLCVSLAWAYLNHGVLDEAIRWAEQAVEAGSSLGEEAEFEACVLHGWLLLLQGDEGRAQAELSPLLMSLEGSISPSPRGVVHTLLALSLRRRGNVQEAGTHLSEALRLARETGHAHNQAIALSNLGCLALERGAFGVAEGFLTRALNLFQELGGGADQEHVQSLLWLGRSYSQRGCGLQTRLANEMALLIALNAKNLQSQLVVAKVLSGYYANKMLYEQSVVYYELCVTLARQLRDKRLEGNFLEILGSLYLSINTQRSLDCTKQSLKICIDLGKRREEAESWLHAGRIHYLLQEEELTDMYLQAAVRTALRLEDPIFTATIYEEAGDVFYKGHRDQLKALPYYRDGSLPCVQAAGSVLWEFRLLQKLTELLLKHGRQQEALHYALLAVQSSAATGVCLHERVSYQRLAFVYESLGQCEMAEHYFLKCVSTGPEVTHPSDARYYTRVYTHLAHLTLYKLKDAFDAMGYYQLAVAAAMEAEDEECVCALLLKLGELHTTHLPDTHLLEHYTHLAHQLQTYTHTPIHTDGPMQLTDSSDKHTLPHLSEDS